MQSLVFLRSFSMPYKEFFGGAIAIDGRTIEAMNGFPTRYYGWGGEDDDIRHRWALHLSICPHSHCLSLSHQPSVCASPQCVLMIYWCPIWASLIGLPSDRISRVFWTTFPSNWHVRWVDKNDAVWTVVWFWFIHDFKRRLMWPPNVKRDLNEIDILIYRNDYQRSYFLIHKKNFVSHILFILLLHKNEHIIFHRIRYFTGIFSERYS